MSTPELWTAVRDLVECWVKSPRVKGIRAELWKDLDSSEALRPLQMLALRQPQDIRRMPLALYKAFPHLGIELTARDRQYMAQSEALERAIVTLTWGIRSKLPGFPLIPAPQLADHSRLTMHSFTPPWTRRAMQAGFQYQNLAPSIAAAIGVDTADPMAQLIAAFRTLPSWGAFEAAQDCLTPTVRSELIVARRLITERATQEQETIEVDSDDPYTRLKRARAAADEVIANLEQQSLTYAKAFDRVNDEIDLTITNVIVSWLAFGPPEMLAGVVGLMMHATQPLTITFQCEGTDFAHIGRIYWTDDSLLTDAVFVDGSHFADNQVHGSSFEFDATVLVGSETAWR
jgi:hypothetical protein